MRSLSAWMALSIPLIVTPAHAVITYLGSGVIAGDSSDDTGLTFLLEDGSPANLAGGMGSGITYSGFGNLYYMVSDRGPGDPSNSWLDRMYKVEVAVTPSGASFVVTPTLVHASLLSNEAGDYFVGNSSAFDSTNSPASLRFDPEDIRLSSTGTSVFVSDEFGPFVYEFDLSDKQRLRSIPVPAKFLIAHPNANNNDELPPNNTSGRQANRSMECLAISPDGSKLYGLTQSPLLQDGALNSSNSRVGTNCRLLEMDLASGATREFLYKLSNASVGATALLAVNDHEFLVLERDGRGLNSGNSAQFKRIFRIDIAAATEISAVASLPSTATPAGVTPVSKVLFLDVLVASGIPGAAFPEKLEGMAFGPDLPDGRHLLVVSADNDFLTNIDSWFLAFAIDPASLPGYVPQQLASVVDAPLPEPEGPTFALASVHPVRDHVRFEYTLARAEHVEITVYDARGRRVGQVFQGHQEAGSRSLTWDCRTHSGPPLNPGTYFARLLAGGVTRVCKIVVVK